MGVDYSKIKNVAISLRKSRGDEDGDVVEKHRTRLIELAERNNWDYTIYNENVVSGAFLEDRDIFKNLLQDVSNKKFNAVLAIDWDRLSRGGLEDYGLIKSVFAYSQTYFVTPQRAYDLTDRNDLQMLGILSVMSNAEYNTIKERFQQGKIGGVKNGRLTNGNPPYPYEKIREIKNEKGNVIVDFKIVVNEEKNEVYQQIKKMYLEDNLGTERIAFKLNQAGVLSPIGKTSSNIAVARLLKSEFHLGKIIYGKSEWKKNPFTKKIDVVKKDENEWIIGYGNHPKLKAEEEHSLIIQKMETNNKVPTRARHGSYPTSGLLFCKQCKRAMVYSVGRKEAKTGKIYDYTKCSYHTPTGKKCPQRGIKMTEDFYDALYNTILNSYINVERLKQQSLNLQEKEKNTEIIKRKQKELEKNEEMLKSARLKVVSGIFNDEDFIEIKQITQPNIKKIKNEIKELQSKNYVQYTKEELEEKINDFKDRWKNIENDEEKNRLLRTIVSKIWYNRINDDVTLEIEYL
ncbi:recombinase family protein [Clostridium sp.]|uniref:recombinase family protein n=1 Tax=Clostridium sp. TaxID=1506 RepID=UPI00258B0922|nr:recombinase family protein [Clostridium sp.]MDF2503052.1 recombinase family protein [Clostridium sp.]